MEAEEKVLEQSVGKVSQRDVHVVETNPLLPKTMEFVSIRSPNSEYWCSLFSSYKLFSPLLFGWIQRNYWNFRRLEILF